MTDELSYLKLAQSIWETLSPIPEVRGEAHGSYSQLYPLLISPLVGLFDMPLAFRLTHLLNALLMASTAIPTYLLARSVVGSRTAALAAAALAAVVPWVTLTFSVMTEAAAYPAFVWGCYAVVVAVARPSMLHDALAIIASVVAYQARTQFVLLLAALPLLVLLHEVTFRLARVPLRQWPKQALDGLKASASGHLVLVGMVLLGGLVLVLGTAAVTPLGAYQSAVIGHDLLPPGTADSLFDHLNQVVIGAGILPLVLTVALVVETLARPEDRAVHAFALLFIVVAPAVALIATSFDLNFAGSTQERYLFYIVPLLAVGAVAGVLLIRRPLISIGIGAVATALMLVQSGYEPLGSFPAFSSPVRFAWVAMDFRAGQLGGLVGADDMGMAPALAAVTLFGAVAVALGIRLRRRLLTLGLLTGALLLWSIALTEYVAPKVRLEHEDMATNSVGKRPMDLRDWVDDAVGSGARVGMVPSNINARSGRRVPPGTTVDQGVWWQVEFWNKSVRRAYRYFGSVQYTPFALESISVDSQTGRMSVSGEELPYLVFANSDVRFAPDGEQLTSPDPDLVLYRPHRPYRVAWITHNVNHNGQIEGTGGAISVFGRHAGRPSTYRVKLVFYPGPNGSAPFRLRGPGVDRRGRMENQPTVSFGLCVPAGARRLVDIGTTSGTGARLIDVEVDRLPGHCSPSARTPQ